MNHQQYLQQEGQQYPPQPPYGPRSYGPPSEPPKRRRRRWPWIVGGTFLALVLIGSLANTAETQTSTAAPQEPAMAPVEMDTPAFGERVVTLQVDGDGSATVTYMKSGGQEQQTVSLPWSTEITADFVVSMNAQKKSGGSSDITCKILEDGDVIAESSSSGQYAMVSCSD